MSIAKPMASFNADYNFPFTKHLLNNSTNFIANAWIVNKFLDYFQSLRLGLSTITNPTLYSFKELIYRSNLQENIERNITDLNFCIEVLNEERKLVNLEIII